MSSSSHLGASTTTEYRRRRVAPLVAICAALVLLATVAGVVYATRDRGPAKVNKAALVPWMNAHLADFRRLGKSIDDYGRASVAADVRGTTPETSLLKACDGIEREADHMLTVEPVPGAEIRRHLVAALHSYQAVAATCLTAAQHGLAGHLGELQTANAQLRVGGNEMSQTSELITQALK